MGLWEQLCSIMLVMISEKKHLEIEASINTEIYSNRSNYVIHTVYYIIQKQPVYILHITNMLSMNSTVDKNSQYFETLQ